MEIAHLRCFVAVADELNFTRAARKLHLATSPLCRRIKNLELELGKSLFLRTNHAVSLTSAGEQLLPDARRVLAEFDSLPLLLHEQNGGTRPTLRIGMPVMLNSKARDRFLNMLRDEFPAFAVVPERDPRCSSVLERVLSDDVAFGFARGSEQLKGLETWPVLVERLGVAIPAGHELAARRTLRLRDLAGLTYITSDNASAPQFFARMDDELHSGGVVHPIELPTHDLELLAHMVASGAGFSLTVLDPSSLARQAFVSDRIALQPLEDVVMTMGTSLVWRTARARTDRQISLIAQAVKRTFPEPIQA